MSQVNTVIGNKWQPKRDVKEVAKEVRKELKNAGLDCSVRLERSRRSASLKITIKSVSSDTLRAQFTRDAIEHRDNIAHCYGAREFDSCWRYQAEKLAESIAECYNKTSRCSHTDYYQTEFFVTAQYLR